MATSNYIKHYQKSIEKNYSDSKRLLHCLDQLFKLSEISIKHLQETGIGRTVNNLRKHEDLEVGIASKALVTKWKTLVAEDSDDECATTEKLSSHNDNKYSDNEDDYLKKLSTNNSNSTSSHHSSHSNGNNSLSSKPEKKTSPKESSRSSKHQKHSSKETSSTKVDEKTNYKSHHKRKHEHHSDSSYGNKKIRSDPDKLKNDDDKPPIFEDFEMQKEIVNKEKEPAKAKSSHREEDKKKSSEKFDERKPRKSSAERSKDSKHHKSSAVNEKDEKDSKSHKKVESSSVNKDEKEKDKKHKRKNVPETDGNEFDGNNGIGFAEALAMFDYPKRSKKSNDVPVITHKSTIGSGNGSSTSKPGSSDKVKNVASSSSSVKVKEEKKPLKNIESLKVTPKLLTQVPASIPPLPDILSSVQISNDYRPNPMSSLMMDCLYSSSNRPMQKMSDEDLLAASFSSKASRTKVFSGNIKTFRGEVPKLFDLCIRMLQENIDLMEYTGGLPFDILKPILEKASPEQLSALEYYNPYLMDESDILWEPHVRRKFKGQGRQEMESWREMFIRCTAEQEDKFRSLTDNIRRLKEKSESNVRRSKIAFVDSVAKAPRSIANKQIKYGTKHLLVTSPAARVANLSNNCPNVAKQSDTRLKTAINIRDSIHAATSQSFKPKKAPLMAKSLQLMKGRLFKR